MKTKKLQFYKFDSNICFSCDHCIMKSEENKHLFTNGFIDNCCIECRCEFDMSKTLGYKIFNAKNFVWLSNVPEKCTKKVEIYATAEYDKLAEIIFNDEPRRF